MITSYTDLMARIQSLLDGDEVELGGDFNSTTLDAVINMAENRIYRDLRSRYNQKSFTALTVTSNAVTLPTDLIAIEKIWITGRPLEPVSEEFLRKYNDNGSTGECKYYAQAGNQIMFAPALTNGTAINGRYYARLPALKTNFVNAVFAAYEDLFVYAALLEGEQFWPTLETSKFAMFYQDILKSIRHDEGQAIYNGGTVRVKPSTGRFR